MIIYFFDPQNVKECILNLKTAKRILSGYFSSSDISEFCYWAPTYRTFRIDFESWYSVVNRVERNLGIYDDEVPHEHPVPNEYREFLEQYVKYCQPPVDLDEDDEECI